MTIFRYRAKNAKGYGIIKGEYTANTKGEAIDALARMGLVVTSIDVRGPLHDGFSLLSPLWTFLNALEYLTERLSPEARATYDPKQFMARSRKRRQLHDAIGNRPTDRLPTFRYAARSLQGGKIVGEMEARDVADLRYRLQVLELELREVLTDPTDDRGAQQLKKLSIEELQLLCYQLRIYLTLDMDVPQMLDAMRQSAADQNLKAILWRVANHMRTQQDSLYETMARYPHYFGRFFLSLVRVGEEAGAFPLVLHYGEKHLQWLLNFHAKLRSGTWLVARSNVFTWALLAPHAAWAHLIPALVLRLLGKLRKRYPRFELLVDGWLLRVPRIGALWLEYDTANFVYLFCLMWQAGIPINDILTIGVEVMHNAELRERVKDVAIAVENGALPSAAFASIGSFPHLLIAALKKGETTCQFELSLDDVYYFYTRALDDAADSMIQYGRVALTFYAAVPFFIGILAGRWRHHG